VNNLGKQLISMRISWQTCTA